MRKIIILLAAALVAFGAQAQLVSDGPIDGPVAESDSAEEEVFYVVETMPEFPNGQQALFQFIYSEMQYPMLEAAQRHQGRAICQFTVNTDGSLSDIRVVRSSGYEALDQEAVRIISRMPSWKPGRQRDRVVRVKYTIPISFKLEPIVVQPQFTGGPEAQQAYLEKNLKYPKDAKKALQEGTAICQFKVGEDGSIKEPEVFVSTGVESMDAEALRLIQKMPKWTPGTSDEKPMEMEAAMIINFTLPAEYINKQTGVSVVVTTEVEGRTVVGKLPVPACREKANGSVAWRVLIGKDGHVISVRDGEAVELSGNVVALCRKAALNTVFNESEQESVGTLNYDFTSKK